MLKQLKKYSNNVKIIVGDKYGRNKQKYPLFEIKKYPLFEIKNNNHIPYKKADEA